jgi:thiamine biosynthesis lipoprotein
MATRAAQAASGQGPLVRYEDSRVSMACTYAIAVYGRDPRELAPVVAAALDEVDRIDRLMSHYKPDSPLSRLNREAANGPVRVDPELFDFITRCQTHSRESQGAFDVTVGPLMKTWGFFSGMGRVPDDQELAVVLSRVGYRHVVLGPGARTVRFDRPGVALDLGGIAKGYAVDRAVRLLRSKGVSAALVSSGGSTLYALGAPPGETGWPVRVRDPIDARKVAFTVRLKDRALSMAGGQEKSFEAGGVRYSHIMDPRSGRPASGVLAVAVVTGTGTDGDALDDAFYVLGVEKSREYLERLPPTRVHLFLPGADGGYRQVQMEN